MLSVWTGEAWGAWEGAQNAEPKGKRNAGFCEETGTHK